LAGFLQRSRDDRAAKAGHSDGKMTPTTKMLFLLWVPTLVCGCSRPPSSRQITGSWQSTERHCTLELRGDNTFTFAKLTNSVPKSGLAGDVISDAFNEIGFDLIPKAGKWRLEGWELSVSDGSIVWFANKIEAWSENTLDVQFTHGAVVHFEKQRADNSSAGK
jgi:hypothetical protein